MMPESKELAGWPLAGRSLEAVVIREKELSRKTTPDWHSWNGGMAL